MKISLVLPRLMARPPMAKESTTELQAARLRIRQTLIRPGALIITLIVLCTATFFVYAAEGGDEENCKKCNCDEDQGMSVEVFDGNIERSKIIDLEIWGAVGQIPMKWERIANSRAFY